MIIDSPNRPQGASVKGESEPLEVCPRCGRRLLRDRDELVCQAHGLQWSPRRPWDVAGAAVADPGLEGRIRRRGAYHEGLALTALEDSPEAEEIDADLWDWAVSETSTVSMGGPTDERYREALRLSRVRRAWERHGELALEGLDSRSRDLVVHGYRDRSKDARPPVPSEPSMPLRWVAWRVARGLPVSAAIVAEHFGCSETTAAGVMAGGWVAHLAEFEEVER